MVKMIFTLIGLFLIFSIFTVEQTKIISPSLQSLIPLIGVTMVLIFLKNTLVGQIISNKIFTFIGKISYSIYLYHFPIVVFLKYNNFEINNYLKFLVFGLTIIFAYLSWKFVEIPFRSEKNM